jgi:hypothetical protein
LLLLAGTLTAGAQTTPPGAPLPTQPAPIQPEGIAPPTPAPSQPLTAPTVPPPLTTTAPADGALPNPTLQPAATMAGVSFVDATPWTVPQRFWFDAEYLLWFIKASPLPPLLTSGSAQDTFPAALGQPHTQTVIGDDSVQTGVHSGGRFSTGYWFTDSHILGMDASFLFLGSQSKTLGAASDGDPVLGRPFINVLNGQETASAVAYPNFQSGTFTARLTGQLWVADVDARTALFYQPTCQLSLLGGFRYLNLGESLHTFEDDTFAPNTGVTQAQISDWIRTSNNFYGGQMGTAFNWVRNRWSVDLLGKVALGVMDECAHLSGASLFTYPGNSATALGVGSLVQPSNSGSYGKDRFAVIPEGTATLGFAVTQHIRLTLGYTFLYVSSVFRPGDQIDRTMNPTEVASYLANQPISGPARPNFLFKSTDFWAQGVNFGVQVRY